MSEVDDGNASGRGGGTVVNELDDGLARVNGHELTWGFKVDTCLEERAQQTLEAVDVSDETPETMDYQGGAVDASSTPVR